MRLVYEKMMKKKDKRGLTARTVVITLAAIAALAVFALIYLAVSGKLSFFVDKLINYFKFGS
tara:strand:- start:1183 stop:1368 length:186 start_codon:yes stop_codon:yes gene_type:complete